ncbi:hypothetical protein BJY04DRAFT_199312 [Aspergillus karnatakaensis]|uniref:uncharacterized protein n=1 Tax=Aspergillus karnatakaensis TaxID=1810916 RepID=UPI003CCD5475
MLSTINKTLLLATALATGSTALVIAQFERFFEPTCTSAIGGATVAETYCVNVEDWPSLSHEAFVTGGECEDPNTSPVLSLFGEPGCETDLLTSFAVGEDAECLQKDITVKSLSLACV